MIGVGTDDRHIQFFVLKNIFVIIILQQKDTAAIIYKNAQHQQSKKDFALVQLILFAASPNKT